MHKLFEKYYETYRESDVWASDDTIMYVPAIFLQESDPD